MSDIQTAKILIAEDDDGSRRLLEKFLGAKGFSVTSARDGSEAYRRFFAEEPDLVLLDVNMPKLDGWTILREIRSVRTVPVIMLTVLDDTRDKVKGLAEGADDYITKPFDLKELQARIHAVLRRVVPRTGGPQSVGGLYIDDEAKEVRLDGRPVSLSPKEYELLRLLASRPGRVFSTEEIIKAVWPERADVSGAEDVKKYVYFLRGKLERPSSYPSIVQTVRGFGYKLAAE